MCVGSPVWSLVRLSENGWITSELFLKWCQMFVKSLPKDDGLRVSTGRKRVKCQLFGCRKWYHNECQGIPEKLQTNVVMMTLTKVTDSLQLCKL